MNVVNSYVGPWGISSDYGWFHVYAFTMFTGMIVAILVSWWKLRSKKIPTDGLIWAVLLIIPASLFGASFFGKEDPEQPMGFWAKFAFWQPGMSIHGGVLFGCIVGLVYFAFYNRHTKVSLWVYGDCIIPNILLGQVIGRWGNFFNHELVGEIVGYSNSLDASNIPALAWLPAFIRDNCFQLIGNYPEMKNGLFVFRAPIFLYESLANLGFWVLLTFVIPPAFRWFSKKPWKVEPNKFPLLKNELYLKPKIWNQAFYQYHPTIAQVQAVNHRYEQTKIKVQKESFFNRNYHMTCAYFTRSNQLYHLQNPKGYFVMRSGVQMWLYFFGWNLIRFCLEIQREDSDLFLANRRALDYGVLISLFVLGLVLAVLSQLVFARYFRKSGWTYEKEY